MLTLLTKALKVLNSEASPWQIGWAIGLGFMAGLLPFGFLTLLILLVVCLFAVNLATFILTWGLCSGLMLIFGGALEAITWQYAQSSWVLNGLASSEFLQFLRLHHTRVLGAFVIGLVLLVPVAWLSSVLVRQYRAQVMAKVNQWRVVRLLKTTRFFQIYQKLS